MAFTGKEGSPIELDTARKWVKNYRDKAGKEAVYAEFFGCDILNKILAQQNADGHCKGIRVYYSLDDEGKQHLLLVGATENENNMLPAENGVALREGGYDDPIIGDDSQTCPPICPNGGTDL